MSRTRANEVHERAAAVIKIESNEPDLVSLYLPGPPTQPQHTRLAMPALMNACRNSGHGAFCTAATETIRFLQKRSAELTDGINGTRVVFAKGASIIEMFDLPTVTGRQMYCAVDYRFHVLLLLRGLREVAPRLVILLSSDRAKIYISSGRSVSELVRCFGTEGNVSDPRTGWTSKAERRNETHQAAFLRKTLDLLQKLASEHMVDDIFIGCRGEMWAATKKAMQELHPVPAHFFDGRFEVKPGGLPRAVRLLIRGRLRTEETRFLRYLDGLATTVRALSAAEVYESLRLGAVHRLLLPVSRITAEECTSCHSLHLRNGTHCSCSPQTLRRTNLAEALLRLAMDEKAEVIVPTAEKAMGAKLRFPVGDSRKAAVVA